MSETLIIFDFDGTLVHEDGRTENLSLLASLREEGYELAISSRNHSYHVRRELQKLKILDILTLVMADFRPKSFQIRDILYRFKLTGKNFKTVYFIDDYSVNIKRVQSDLSFVITLQFGKDVSSLEDVISRIETS